MIVPMSPPLSSPNTEGPNVIQVYDHEGRRVMTPAQELSEKVRRKRKPRNKSHKKPGPLKCFCRHFRESHNLTCETLQRLSDCRCLVCTRLNAETMCR